MSFWDDVKKGVKKGAESAVGAVTGAVGQGVSTIGSMIGVGGGQAGTGFSGPSAVPTDPRGFENLQKTYEMLAQIAAGKGPDAAQAQYLANLQNLQRQQSGAISSIQGISPALASRMITQQQSGVMQQGAAEAQANKYAQQLAAMQGMAGVAGTQAGGAAQLQASLNAAQANLMGARMGQQGQFWGGLAQGIGASKMPGAFKPVGGGQYAEGGEVQSSPVGPQSRLGQYFMGMAEGGPVHDYTSGGGVQAAAPQQKAVKSGDSYANDKVPAMLSEGEVVIPRSVMQGKNPERGAAEFVRAVMAKRGRS